MRISGFSWFAPAALPRMTPTDALFADQGHSIPDNLVALLAHSRAWNCSDPNAQSETHSWQCPLPGVKRTTCTTARAPVRTLMAVVNTLQQAYGFVSAIASREHRTRNCMQRHSAASGYWRCGTLCRVSRNG